MAAMGPGADPNALVGQVVAGYRLVESIGMGASSWVYRGVRLPEAPQSVEVTGLRAIEYPAEAAIKLFVVIGGTLEERADNRRRFLAEADALKQLRHANIVPIIASGEDTASGYTYMILPYMAGLSLARLLAQHGPLPLERVSDMLTQIAAALDEAHREIPGARRGVVHRDVKPANILLDATGRPYLADFSIARILSQTSTLHTMSGRLLGTPIYMAPEQFGMTNRVGPAADIYSLGMVVYEMVTGHAAFDGPDAFALMGQHLTQAPASPRDSRPDLPAPAEAAILQALAKEPTRRFSSASAFARAFALGLHGQYSPELASQTFGAEHDASHDPTIDAAPAGTILPPTARPRQSRRLLVGMVAGTLLVALVAGTALAGPANILRGARSMFSPQASAATPTSTTAATATTAVTSPTASKTATATSTPHPKATATASSASGGGSPPVAPVVQPTPTPVPTGPAVYVGSYDSYLYALSANNGTLRWRFGTGSSIFSSPAVSGGTVYFGSWDGALYAVNAQNGAREWKYQTGGAVYSSPALANGSVYFGSWDNRMYALNAGNGALEWSYATGNYITSSPVVVGGVVYFGSDDYNIYALDAGTGALIWKVKTGAPVYAIPAVVNGVVYEASRDSTLYAINASTGAVLWTFTSGGSFFASPVLANGVVYIGSNDHYFYALNASNGQTIWRYYTGGGFSSADLAGSIVYVGCTNDTLYAFNAGSGSVVWQFAAQGAVVSTPVYVNDVIYVGSDDGNVYAVSASSGARIWSHGTGSIIHSTPAVV